MENFGDHITGSLNTGLADGIKHCFKSVFSELNLATESWFQETKFRTVGIEKYAQYIANSVGVFPLFASNRSVSIENFYIDLQVTMDVEREKYRSREQIEFNVKSERFGMTRHHEAGQTISPLAAIEQSEQGFVLIGSPGSGKTTTFRWIAVQAAMGKKILGKTRIPIYIAVRDMPAEGVKIKQFVVSIFKMFKVEQVERVVESLFLSGRLLILVDGLDEISEAHQKNLILEIMEMKNYYHDNIYCVSARPHSLNMGLPAFLKWETLALPHSKRLEFVKLWFKGLDPKKGELLIQKCEKRPEILDIGSNPLLLSIACALFNNDLDIPTDPDEMLQRAVDGMLGGWDDFRSIARNTVLGKLSRLRRETIVQYIAAYMMQEGRIVFDIDDIEKSLCLEKAFQVVRTEPIESESVIKSLVQDFGILTERSPRLFSFSHLTLQDFLVAKYVVNNRVESELLRDRRVATDWGNIVRLVAKLLPNADKLLTSLHENTKIENVIEVDLMHSVWLAKPLCTDETRNSLMAQLAKKIAWSVKTIRTPIKLKDGVLLIRAKSRKTAKKIDKHLSKKDSIEQIKHQIDENEQIVSQLNRLRNPHSKTPQKHFNSFPHWQIIFRTLPTLLKILELGGFSAETEDVDITNNSLFKILKEQKTMNITDILFDYEFDVE